MSEDQFTKLFKYVQEMRVEMNDRFDNTASAKNLNSLTNSVDAYAKQTESYMQEMLMLGHKVDRLEQWILKVAEATGVKLSA